MKYRHAKALLYVLALIPALLFPAGVCRAEDERTFGGLRFGAGLSITFDTGNVSRVDSAKLVNGIVRVDEDNDVIPRLLLESHYFFPASQKEFLGVKNPGTWAWGPFVGVQSSTDEVIDGFAMGVMVGFRRDTPEGEKAAKELRVARENAKKTDSGGKKVAPDDAATKEIEDKKEANANAADTAGASSFNIGIGVMLDPHVQVLGDGITANQPLPSGETEIRYKTTHQTGVVVMFSFSF